MQDPGSNPHEGGCTCGAVRTRMGPPLFVNCCHCTWCQRETGSAFVLNAMIEAEGMVVTRGRASCVPLPTASGRGQKVWRCARCQVALWSTYSGAGERVRFVRVGTLDAPDRLPPDVHIFTASKLPWVALPTDRPVFPAYYDREVLWPAASLARWRRLKAGR